MVVNLTTLESGIEVSPWNIWKKINDRQFELFIHSQRIKWKKHKGKEIRNPKLINVTPFNMDVAPGKNTQNFDKRGPMSIPDSRVPR